MVKEVPTILCVEWAVQEKIFIIKSYSLNVMNNENGFFVGLTRRTRCDLNPEIV